MSILRTEASKGLFGGAPAAQALAL